MNQGMKWEEIDENQYRELEKKVRRLPLIQSSDYNAAASEFYGHVSQGLSLPQLGLCRINSKGVFKDILQAVMCDRAPVWFEGQGGSKNFEDFVKTLKKQYPRRPLRKRRFIPENENAHEVLIQNGFKKIGDGYQTIWLDLTQDQEMLRSNLKKNWRGALKKAEQAGLEIEWDKTGQTLPLVLKTYQIDKKRRNYPGPSVPFMKVLAQHFAKSGNLLIGRALLDGYPVGSILILCHGASATYQIGWTSDQGRKTNAHHWILWNALNVLKQRGIKDFDLGGINDKDASGVAKFKSGMGGDIVRLPGLYG